MQYNCEAHEISRISTMAAFKWDLGPGAGVGGITLGDERPNNLYRDYEIDSGNICLQNFMQELQCKTLFSCCRKAQMHSRR